MLLNNVLDRFAEVDAQAASLVKLRYYIVMKLADVSQTLGMSQCQAHKLWTLAKACLRDAIQIERLRA
jgi:hypothetical protein